MISRETFDIVRSRYGYQASWAIWGEQIDKPKSGMGDLTIFDDQNFDNIAHVLHTNFVIVALNISTIDIEIPLSNFHGTNGEVYKLRFAVRNSPLWGCYITDVLKDYKDSKSVSVANFLQTPEGQIFEQENVHSFAQEIADVGAENATLIALGADVERILRRHFSRSHKIVRAPHYGMPTNKENYRDRFWKSIGDINN